MIRWNDKISQKCQQLFPIKMIECHESNQHLLTRFTMTRANLRKIVAISRKKAAASPSPSKHLNNRIEPYNVKKWKKKMTQNQCKSIETAHTKKDAKNQCKDAKSLRQRWTVLRWNMCGEWSCLREWLLLLIYWREIAYFLRHIHIIHHWRWN